MINIIFFLPLLLPFKPSIVREGDIVSYTEQKYITSICIDLRYVYIGTKGGVARYDKLKDEWISPLTDIWGLSDNFVTDCRVVRDEVWFLTPKGISKYNQGIQRWTTSSNTTDFPTKDTNLNLDDPKYSFLVPFYFQDEKFRRYEITALAEEDRNLWVGSSGYGLFVYNLLTWNYTHYLFGLAKNPVNYVYKDGNILWIGGIGRDGESDGITRWDRKKCESKFYEMPHTLGILSNDVYTIEANQDFVWFGTKEGLCQYDKKRDRFDTYTIFDGLPGRAVLSLELYGDKLFCGTDFGLSYLDLNNKKIKRIKPVGESINDITTIKDRIYYATPKGVFYFQRGKFELLEDPFSSLAVGTNCITGDENTVWFGTRVGVIFYCEKTGEWKQYLAPTYFSNGNVQDIALDEHNLWLATPVSLVKYNREKNIWREYDPDFKVNSILIEGDYLWLGTPRGLVRFYWNNPFLPK